MDRFLICDNSKCRFMLDRRINGRSLDGLQHMVRQCPSCGGSWSSTCPSCGQALAVKLVGGLPHSVCCDRKSHHGSAAA
jgi:predicted  nucleic acid-binding Zn ribbon protein